MDINLDDLDLEGMDFDDQFPDFDMQEDVNGEDRTPLDSIRTGAIEAATDPNNLMEAGKAAAKNALPKGYSEFADGIGDLKDTAERAIEEAKKQLEGSGKAIREVALKHSETAEKILPKSLMEKFREDKEYEKIMSEGSKTQEQKDDLRIQSAMADIFKENSQAQALRDAEQASLNASIERSNMAVAEESLQRSNITNSALSRLVSFNENIVNDYYRKTLELEFKQYFALRDIRDTQIAYFKDTDTYFKAIVKNTALPDILKGTMTEEYFQLSQENLLGKVNETMSERLGNYGSRFKDNLVGKAKEWGESLNQSIVTASDYLTMDALDDIPEDQKNEMYANMATSMLVESLGESLGNRLANVVKKYPKVASSGLELLYLKDNAPVLIDELLTQGDDSEIARKIEGIKGSMDAKINGVKESISSGFSKVTSAAKDFMPDSMREKVDAYQQRRAEEKEMEDIGTFDDLKEEKDISESGIAGFIRSLVPTLGTNQLSFNNEGLENAYKSMSYDVASRTALVDVIPTLLTENNRLLNVIADGDDSRATSYDYITGQLTNTKDAQDSISREFMEAIDASSKNVRLDRILGMLDPEGTLDEKEKEEISRVLIKQANGFAGAKVFRYERLIEQLSSGTADKVSELVGVISEKDEQEQGKYRNFFAREAGYLNNGFDRAQTLANQMVMAGGRQELVESELFMEDPKDPTRQVLNPDALVDAMLSYEKGYRADLSLDRVDSSSMFSGFEVPEVVMPEIVMPEPVMPPMHQDMPVANITRDILFGLLSDQDNPIPVEVVKDTALEAAEIIVSYMEDHKSEVVSALEANTALLKGIGVASVTTLDEDTKQDMVMSMSDLAKSAGDKISTRESGYEQTISDFINGAMTKGREASESIGGFLHEGSDKFNFAKDSLRDTLGSVENPFSGMSIDDLGMAYDQLKSNIAQAADNAPERLSEFLPDLQAINAELKSIQSEQARAGGLLDNQPDSNMADIEQAQEQESIRGMFFESLNGQDFIPVMDVTEVVEDGIDETQAMIDAITGLHGDMVEGMTAGHAIASAILESMEGIGEDDAMGDRGSIMGRVMRATGDFAKKAGSGIGQFTQMYYTGLGNFFRGAGSGARNVLGGVGDFLFGKKGDRDNPEGDDGNGRTNPIMAALGMVTNPVTAMFEAQKTLFEQIGGAGKAAFGMAKSINDKTEDVYVGGETSPRLLALVFRNGGYYNANGQSLYSHKDIDGDVFDQNGNVILSVQEMSNGLYNRDGQELSKGLVSDLMSKAWKGTKGIVKWGGNVIKGSVEATASITTSLASGVAGVGKWAFGKNRGESGDGSGEASAINNPTVDLIYEHMLAKWPVSETERKEAERNQGQPTTEEHVSMEEELLRRQVELMEEEKAARAGKAGDSDGDGKRDGSWRAQRAASANREKPNRESKRDRKEKEEESADRGLMLTLLAGIGSGITAIAGAIGSAMGLKATADIAGSAADVLGGAGDGIDAERRRKGGGTKRGGGKAGRMSKVLNGLKGATGALGSGLMTAGSAIGRGAMAAGRVALGTGGAIVRGGMAVAGAIAGSPIAAGMAVGLAAYGAYKAIDWFVGGMDAEPLERIRFLQYGISPDAGGILRAIRDVEEFALDNIDFDGSKVNFDYPPVEDIVEELSDIFGWGEPTQQDKEAMLRWWDDRFVPVFLWHTGAIASLDTWVDIDDIDDEIEDEHMMPFLRAINKDEFLGRKFYEVKKSPAPGLELANTKSTVDSEIKALMAKYDDAPDAKKEEKKSSVDTAKTAAAATTGAAVTKAFTETGTLEGKKAPKIDEVAKNARRMTTKSATTKFAYGVGASAAAYSVAPKTAVDNKGDLIVTPKDGESVKIASDGYVTDKGYSPNHGLYFTVREDSGREVLYKDIEGQLTINMGDRVKAGQDVGGRPLKDGFKVSTYKGGAKTQPVFDENQMPDAKYVRNNQDRIIAHTDLPIVDRDNSLKTVRDAVSVKDSAISTAAGVTTGLDAMVEKDAKEQAEKYSRGPVTTAGDLTNSTSSSIQIASATRNYYDKSVIQRNDMIKLLTEIKTGIEAINERAEKESDGFFGGLFDKLTGRDGPTQQEGTISDFRSSVPVNYNRPKGWSSGL